METDIRTLGKTGLKVNAVGMGGIPIQKLSAEEGKEVILSSIGHGVNFIDTARGYTCSEEYIGYALRGMREKVYLATKSGARTYEAMKKDIKISLDNLETDYIDLYQFHNVKGKEEWETIVSENGAMRALSEAKEKGQIRHIGVTSHNGELLKEILESGNPDVETIQYPLNFLEDEGLELFRLASSKNIGTIAMKPLGGGMIGDGATALKWLLKHEYLSVAVPGMSSVHEAEINSEICRREIFEKDFTEAEKEYINNLKEETKGNFCHRCGYCLPCTVGIDIPGMITLERYYSSYGLQKWALDRYFKAKVRTDACIGCGVCMARCPYQIDIPGKMKAISELFGKAKKSK